MTTDRELLELAAKAAGYTVCESFRNGEFRVCGPDRLSFAWGPHTDDGDALRLAVKLDIHIEQNTSFKRACALWYGKRVLREELFEPWGDDKLAATRLAIVRAAAEIGKAMP